MQQQRRTPHKCPARGGRDRALEAMGPLCLFPRGRDQQQNQTCPSIVAAETLTPPSSSQPPSLSCIHLSGKRVQKPIFMLAASQTPGNALPASKGAGTAATGSARPRAKPIELPSPMGGGDDFLCRLEGAEARDTWRAQSSQRDGSPSRLNLTSPPLSCRRDGGCSAGTSAGTESTTTPAAQPLRAFTLDLHGSSTAGKASARGLSQLELVTSAERGRPGSARSSARSTPRSTPKHTTPTPRAPRAVRTPTVPGDGGMRPAAVEFSGFDGETRQRSARA